MSLVVLLDIRHDDHVIIERDDSTNRGREEIERARRRFYETHGYYPAVGIREGDVIRVAGRGVKQEGLDASRRWHESQCEEQERREWARRIFAQV